MLQNLVYVQGREAEGSPEGEVKQPAGPAKCLTDQTADGGTVKTTESCHAAETAP